MQHCDAGRPSACLTVRRQPKVSCRAIGGIMQAVAGSARQAGGQCSTFPSLSSFFFFNPCTGWLWLSQGRRSDEEEHEPFVQTPSAERVKKKENGKKNRRQITRRRNSRSLQFLAASFIQREATLQRAAPNSALQSPVCFLPPSTHTDREGAVQEEGAL